MTKYRILLGGESPWCHSLAQLFFQESDFDVVGQVHLDQLPGNARMIQPDLLLLQLSGANLDFLEEVRVQCPFTISILVVDNPNRYNMMELLQNGVRGLLPARLFPMQIIRSVELMAEGGIVCMPCLEPNAFAQDSGHRCDSKMNALTGREKEVLNLLEKSYSNQEIAESLCISESTVKTHLRNIFRKLDVRNRTQATVTAFQYESRSIS